MMCLAEALLRIPDAHTADELIADKLAGPDWSDKLGESDSAFVNAATFSLLLTGKVLEGANDRTDNWRSALGRAVGRLGEPVVRAAVREAMKILGRNFVFGRTIDEALKRAAPERQQRPDPQLRHARRGGEDLRGCRALCRRLSRRPRPHRERGEGRLPRVSGHFGQADRAPPALSNIRIRPKRSPRCLPIVRELALKASKADVHFTIDAEEADRLELQLDVFEALLADDALFANGWGGFGIAIQAYQKRALPLCEWVAEAARAHGRKLMVRLVKGAYWDTEVKAAQVGGPARLSGVHAQGRYRRVLSCLRESPARRRRVHLSRLRLAQCEHAWPGQSAGQGPPVRVPAAAWHGRGAVRRTGPARACDRRCANPVRIYAPVGSYKELLAYLVRRLLENGANSSFVNRIADEQISLGELVRDPVAELEALKPKRNPRSCFRRDFRGRAAQ